MTHTNTLTSETRSTTYVDGLEVEIFATEQEARAAFAAVPSYVECQAAAFVTQTAHLTSQQDERTFQTGGLL
jgi:hypothetical protein